MAQGSKNKTTTTGKSRKSSTGRSGTSAKKQETYEEEGIPAFLGPEVMIILSFMAAVLLFLSNFHLCGVVGDFLRRLQLGLFGVVGYVLPFFLFIGTSFYMANQGNRKAAIKLAAVTGGLLAICGLAQMMFGATLEPGDSILSFYQLSSEGKGGGLIGGALSFGLRSVVGSIGAYLILLAALIICGVCITEKSVVNVVKTGSGRAYQYAKEDAIRRKEEREERLEERRRLREDNVVRGVDFGSLTFQDPNSPPAPESETGFPQGQEMGGPAGSFSGRGDGDTTLEEKPSSRKRFRGKEPSVEPARSSADVFTGRIDIPPEYEEPVPFAEDVQGQETMTGRSGWALDERTASKEQPGEEKILSFAKKGGKGKAGPLYADRELMTMEELDDTLPVPALPGGEPEPETWEKPDRLGDLSMETPEDLDGSITFEEEPSQGGISSGASWDFFRDEPSPKDSAAALDDEGLQHLQHAGGGQAGQVQPLASLNLDNHPGQTAMEEVKDQSGRDLAHYSSQPIWEEPTSQPDQESLEVSDVQPGAPWDEPAVQPRQRDWAGPAGQEQNQGFRHGSEQKPQSIFVPEGEKRVVTANGKIIETETELLHKRIETRREEAAADGPQAALRASQKAPEPVKKPYVFPPTSLLKKGSRAAAFSEEEYKETAIKLQQTLRNFGVGVTVTNISCGPSVTRYELHPEQGVKVSRIVGLADDIKLSLAAAEIRIEAPIPGKSAVGIEVPNKETSMVYLRELLESDGFVNSKSKLTFAVGKDIGGQPVTADIGKMPHLLIAGATGSGKSVCINTLIMSIIFKADPEDVKLIMVDPKVVELSVYNGIPHLMIPVVTDPKKASGALNWAVAEMGDRYKKFAEYNVRDLKGYNEKIKNLTGIPEENRPKKLPQIVIIIDELADLMMVVPGEVEDAICRLAQLARAAGIHLVIATQRPSVNVITGLIKANVPSRIAFSVSSGVDSRTIIDMNGAEKLLGKGDMLFYPSGVPKPQRVQGAFVSDQEVSQVVEFLTEQGLTTSYSAEVESRVMNSTLDSFGGGDNSRDEYFAQAGRFIIEKEKASIGMLQRMFKIGFNRAARIMDQLAEAGVVGEEEGTKPRKVLMTMEEFEHYLSGGN